MLENASGAAPNGHVHRYDLIRTGHRLRAARLQVTMARQGLARRRWRFRNARGHDAPERGGTVRPRRRHHTSRLETVRALSWMKARRGSTTSPISFTSRSSASWTSLTFT